MILLIFVVAGFAGLCVGFVLAKEKSEQQIKTAKLNAIQIKHLNDEKIKRVKAEISRKNKENAEQYRASLNSELADSEQENSVRGQRLERREASLLKQNQRISENQKFLDQKQKDLKTGKEELKQARSSIVNLKKQRNDMLQQNGGISTEQAKQLILSQLKTDLAAESGNQIKNVQDEMLLNAPKDASNLMVESLQDGPLNVPRQSIERSVEISEPQNRAKITGKNAQRLRLIESLTGVDLIFNPDNPDELIINTSDPTRREITKETINQLINEKNVTNAKIELKVNEVEKEVSAGFRKTGEEVCLRLHLGWVHPDLMKTLGRLKFRTSYGQNVLQHSIEVAQISAVIASELGLDVALAKRAGLFHDIGKAIDRETEGTHVELGVTLCETYGEDPVVINAIASHHGDVDPNNPISIIVAVADGMSGARPGARSESVEEYINRLKNLEKIADEQPGVKNSYAIQAGREIRIIVDPQKLNDPESEALTANVSKQIENEMTYPGDIKVTAIRKLTAVSYVGGKQKKKIKNK